MPIIKDSIRAHWKSEDGILHAAICIGMGIALLAALCIYLHYSFSVYPKADFNSDDSFFILLSNEMLHQHRLFPDWNYSTFVGIPIFPPQNIILPILMAFSEHWIAAYRSAVAIDQIIMALVIWWILGCVNLSKTLRLFLLCCIFAPLSFDFAWQSILTGQKSWIFAEQIMLAYLVFYCVKDDDGALKQKWKHFVLLGALSTLLFFDKSNVGQLLLPVSVALGGLLLFKLFTTSATVKPRSYVVVFGVFLISLVLGQALFHIFISKASYAPLSPKYVDLSTAYRNFQLLIHSLIILFGAAPKPGDGIYSIGSALVIVKFGLMILAFISPFVLATQWTKLRSDFIRLLIIIFLTSISLRTYVYIFADISLNATNTNRYFIPDALLGITIGLLYIGQHWPKRLINPILLTLAVLVIGSSSFIQRIPDRDTGYRGLVNTLEDNNLHLGYGTFWDSNVLTALSNGKVQVRPIILKNGGIAALHWISSNRWYEGDDKQTSSFLLLKGDEKNIDLKPLAPILGSPVRTFDIGDVRVLVYPFDISMRMGWKYHVKGPLTPSEMRSSIELVGTPKLSVDGKNWLLTIRIKNNGDSAIGTDGTWPVSLGAHLLENDGKVIDNDYFRNFLPMIAPNQSIELDLSLTADKLSDRIVEFDLVQDGVAWFASNGSHALRVSLPR